LRKYKFSTRTGGVVFALLLLRTGKAEEVINELLPTPTTRTWGKWKTIVLDHIKHGRGFDFGTSDWDDGTWTNKEKEMLVGLFQDAHDAH
ncbi:hypothetical protein EDD16DRAFT_1444032, partial [Pisolithus croceorrhizus]